MKIAIDAGKIGTPVLGTFSMFSWRDQAYYESDPWRGKWSTEGGGVLVNQSPHMKLVENLKLRLQQRVNGLLTRANLLRLPDCLFFGEAV